MYRASSTAWRLGDLVLVVLRILPYALLWLGFTLFYTGLPNTEVRTRSAIFGAVVAGTLWQFAQWGYVTFVIRLVRYSAVYGALWQLPILLAWVYIAWGVILYGAEVSRVHQEVYEQRAHATPCRTTNTGHGACRMSFSAVLPMMRSASSERPCVAVTMHVDLPLARPTDHHARPASPISTTSSVFG